MCSLGGLAKFLEKGGSIIQDPDEREEHIAHMKRLGSDTQIYYSLILKELREKYQINPLNI